MKRLILLLVCVFGISTFSQSQTFVHAVLDTISQEILIDAKIENKADYNNLSVELFKASGKTLIKTTDIELKTSNIGGSKAIYKNKIYPFHGLHLRLNFLPEWHQDIDRGYYLMRFTLTTKTGEKKQIGEQKIKK